VYGILAHAVKANIQSNKTLTNSNSIPDDKIYLFFTLGKYHLDVVDHLLNTEEDSVSQV